jgi:predicted acetyltransferase
MSDDREYREVDEATFDRYVRYAFRPTAGPPDEASADEASGGDDAGEGTVGEGSADDGTDEAEPDEDGPEVERFDRGLYRPGREDPVAVAGYHDFRTRVRGEHVRIGGVTLVATPPEHRRQGHVRELMRRMLEELHEEGIHLSALWPFKRSFYRRLGWETGSRYVRIEAPPEQLRSAGADGGGEFHPTAADDWERLVPIHEAHDAGRGLHVDRTEAWWRERVFEGWGSDPYVYRWEDDGGEPGGYLTYTVDDGDDGRVLRVYEAAWADGLARRQLLRFLGDHDSQVETVRLPVPFDPAFPTLETVEDPSSVTVEVEAGHAVRLTDVADGLSALAYPEGASDALRIEVLDPLVDANDGTFRLSVEGGRAECSPATGDGDPAVSLGIGRLSQLAVGYRDASAMAAAGDLDAPADAVARLDALFPAEPVWLREGF